MPRALALLMVVVAAFIVLMGVLAIFAGIAPAFPTTEESFLKIGPTEVEGVVLAVVGAVLVAGGYFLTRFAGSIYR
jgi:uncharacterized membrane protein